MSIDPFRKQAVKRLEAIVDVDGREHLGCHMACSAAILGPRPTVPTLNPSGAHSADDVEWSLGAVRRSLLRTQAGGARAGLCRNQT